MRFPGFVGEWERKKLGELSQLITKGTTPKRFTDQGVRYVKIESFNENSIDIEKCVFIDEFTHNKELKRSILKEGDILFAIAGATIGKTNIVTKAILPANTNQALAIVRLNQKENKNFIIQILKSLIMQKYIKESISVGAQPNLNLEQMSNFSFCYPNFDEQTKIASFLSLVDERIQTQNKIIDNLKVSKSAIAKKIFSQELRFKDENGNDFYEWTKVVLESVCDIKKGTQFNREELKEFGSYPCLNGGISPSGFSEKYNTSKNTITISEGGNSCGFVNFMKTKFWLGGHCYKVVIYNEINLLYFYQLLKFNEQNLMNLRVGSGLPNIQLKDLKRFSIEISLSEREQTKIANFLSSIDTKIDVETQLLQKLKAQKKFLLQNMFV